MIYLYYAYQTTGLEDNNVLAVVDIKGLITLRSLVLLWHGQSSPEYRKTSNISRT